MYPRFTPASTSDLSVSDVGETSHFRYQKGRCMLFQPRIRAVGLSPTSDSQLSVGESIMIHYQLPLFPLRL